MLIMGAFVGIRADIAPDKGFKRIPIRMTLETNEDLSDHRFFVISSDLVKEIHIRSGEKTTVGPLGGGARYRSGKIVAIPTASLREFGDDLTGDQLAELRSTVANDGPAGTTELLTQDLFREVVEGYPGDAIETTMAAGSDSKGGIAFAITDVGVPLITMRRAMIAGGVLITLAFVVLGLLVFRKLVKRSA